MSLFTMKWWSVNTHTFTRIFVGWLAAANLFALASHTLGWWPFKVALFLCLALLPGLVLMRIVRVAFRAMSIYILYAFALSLLVLMLTGLITNTALHALGIDRPLDIGYAFAAWNIATIGLIYASHRINRDTLHIPKLQWPPLKSSWMLIGLSALMPVLATFGAWRLNNGSDGIVALIALLFAAALIVYTCVLRQRLPDAVIIWFVFMLGLSVLLMTSMRGWDITGHDIEREFRVFTLTNQQAHWDIAAFRDPYNACLSITILPHMLSVMLGVSGVIVFKLILQLAFAACVAVIYVLLRRYTGKLAALGGSILFICYPTFINDAAMLTRQGVAYLFFALAILIIAYKPRWRYKTLFLLCASGAIISHYSTAYMFVSLFALAVICKYVAKWWQKRKVGQLPKKHSNSVLSPLFAVSLFLLTFIWYAQITATSGGLTHTLVQSIQNIPSLFTDDNKSTDVAGALFFASEKTQADLYENYLSGTITPQQAQSDNTIMPGLISDTLPPTTLGTTLQNWGVDISLTSTLRQHYAKILQALAIAGVAYAVYRFARHKPHTQGLDFTCLSLASIILLGLMVILPVLSVNYGILRAFQQALIFLILPITLLLIRIAQPLPRRPTNAIAGSGIVLLFLLFTGTIGQMLGGASPPVTLNNQGLYYGLYYAPAPDRASFEWMQQSLPKDSDVRAANFLRAYMNDPHYPFNRNGILPTQIIDRSYIYLDHSQIRDERFYAYYESSPLTMTFPIDYYNLTKNHIFSTGTTGVYR